MTKTVWLVALVIFASHASVVWAAGSAKGKLCGASGCVALPAALALQLSGRNDTFSSESTPKPSPYYKIVIQATVVAVILAIGLGRYLSFLQHALKTLSLR